MIKVTLLFWVVIASCISTEAQIFPAFIQKLPLKQNQLVERWEDFSRNGYSVDTYLDDGVINEYTIDSLAGDSKIFMDSIINTAGRECNYWRFRYINKSSIWEEAGIFLEYWLKNGRIEKIDSVRDDNFEGDIKFPLLPNQYFSWECLKSGSTDINDLVVCNIIAKNKVLNDSLNSDNKKILLRLLKTPPPTGLDYTAIRIAYVDQFTGGIIKEYKYPLTERNNADYYLKRFGDER